ncbi:vitamin D3 hydroxylase-associated protein-like [Mytilus californianus]|uniref:vitamin D3 hydroxylase-associated protein-like n=1 Tax=Mytilus californianus TaxID=6549 RepID=UPI00224805FE|nr:vitamin D3 hydroxylase-associated protein-like [Mytilus californianus]XP_052095458.1 vitamin D3 hydroxylase-associated protein-like [Mytilus californianus]XP_052095459.1 vitamin D3 hydroxylase-associated protein-like [Mytilus californianus]
MDRVIRTLWKQWDSESPKEKKIVIGVIAGSYLSYRAGKILHHYYKKYENNQKIKRKQEECRESKEKLKEFLMEKKISKEAVQRIVSLPFKDLQTELQSGKITAVEVLHAYQIKALEVDKLTNCITEVIWEAEEIALSRDLNANKKGPLHGIPISLKESFMIPGYDCTAGLAFYLDKPAKQENVLVQVLKQAGAVPFVRTNIPQGMMTYECSNPIHGITGNPHDPKRIPGGSSGGEGALIAGGGSILGFGSDIGGSLRIPAHMCGCCSLKPTVGRLSDEGQNDFGDGQTLVIATPGPMAADVDGLVSSMKCLLVPKMFNLDPAVSPVPFRNEIYEEKRKLNIGFYVDDGSLKSIPACQRAVLEVKAMLESQGHTLIPFEPLDISKMSELFIKATFADGGKIFVDILSTDQVDPTISITMMSFKMPKWLYKVMVMVGRLLTKDHMMTVFGNSFLGVKSITEYWDLALQIKEYKTEFLKKWRDNKLDAMICPGFAYTAIPHGTVQYVISGVTYTILYNLLNYPAGILKVTNVKQQDIDNFKDYPSNTYTEKLVKEHCKDSVGLPVGVQFVGLPYQEELVLQLMKAVETSLKTGKP